MPPRRMYNPAGISEICNLRDDDCCSSTAQHTARALDSNQERQPETAAPAGRALSPQALLKHSSRKQWLLLQAAAVEANAPRRCNKAASDSTPNQVSTPN